MEIDRQTRQKYSPQAAKRSAHLHSANHVLADELCQKMHEPKRFAFYLGFAKKYDHNFLRMIAGRVLEADARKPGALFAYLVKSESKKVN